VWVAAGAGPCLLLLGSSAVAHGLQHDVELQRLRHVLPPLLELVAHGEQLLRLEVELHAPHAGECALRCAVGGWVQCGCAVQCETAELVRPSREGEHEEGERVPCARRGR
jgi:hypothetical protein